MNSFAYPVAGPIGETDADPSQSTTDLGGFVAILRKHLRRIILTTLASLALAAAYLATASPVYTASTTLFIDPRLKKIVTDEVTQGGLGSDVALVESQVAIIGSDAVLKRAVQQLKLDTDPEFAPPQGTGVLSRLKALVIKRPPAPDTTVQAVESLSRGLKVKRAQKTYIVDIEASASSPIKAARISEAIVEAYLVDQREAKQAEAKRANELIDARLGELREQVRRGETKADEFRKANRILTSEGGLVNEQQLTRINGELITARALAAEAKARFDQANAAIKSGASADTLPDALRSGLVQRLREQYAQVARREAALSSQLQPRHPVLIEVRSQSAEIRSQIAAELKRIATSALSETQIAANRERELSAALERAKIEVGRTNTAQIKLRELEQEVNASRELLRVFIARAKELQEQQSIATADARVISPAAVPAQPAKPLGLLIMGLGLIGGLGLGVARALVADQLDARLHSADRIARATGLATVGAVPALAVARRSQPVPLGRRIGASGTRPSALADLLSAIAESRGAEALAYRRSLSRITWRLRSALTRGRRHTLLVAAAERGAGASATALGIAYAAAMQGQRVLLIDAASADPELSDIFAAELDTDRAIALDNREHLASILARDARSGLSILPIALADLRSLGAQQRQKLSTGLARLVEDYDLVVIDAGALLEDDSALQLAGGADRAVLVARADTTKPHDLSAAAGAFEGAGRDKLAGVVLTMTTPEYG